jgi:hypothetical protein
MIKFILFLLVNGAIINTSDATMDVVSAEDINQSVAEQEKKIHSRLEAIEKQSVDDLLEIKNQKTLLLKLKQEKDNAAAALVETQAKLKAQTEAMQKIKQEKDIAAATLVETQATLKTQTETISRSENLRRKLEKEQSESIEKARKIKEIIKRDMPQSLSAQEPSLLDEGSGVASATSLLSNIENSLMFIHEQKVQKVQKLQKQKELQKKMSKVVDHRSAEEIDMEKFSKQLDNLDTTQPLMQQLLDE